MDGPRFWQQTCLQRGWIFREARGLSELRQERRSRGGARGLVAVCGNGKSSACRASRALRNRERRFASVSFEARVFSGAKLRGRYGKVSGIGQCHARI